MAFSEFEQKKIEKALNDFLAKRRPEPHIRPKLDFGYRITGLSVELLEIRPQWNNPEIIREHPFAKATYVKTKKAWKVFWQRADLKWHGYQPNLMVPSIEKFLQVVDTDEYGCFFG
jgi:hypothetical protein